MTSSSDRRSCSEPDTANHHHSKSSKRDQLRPAIRRNPPSHTMTASTVSSNYTHASSTSHPYLGDRQVDAIESWKTTVQSKATCPARVPDEDPVIQAYLQTKMALFQSLVSASNSGDVSTGSGRRHVDAAGDRTNGPRRRTELDCYAE